MMHKGCYERVSLRFPASHVIEKRGARQVTIPRQSPGCSNVRRSKRLIGGAKANRYWRHLPYDPMVIPRRRYDSHLFGAGPLWHWAVSNRSNLAASLRWT